MAFCVGVTLLTMHRRFMRRTSLGTGQGRITELRRRRSFGRTTGAEIQMVILLIATSAVVLICSIPLVVQVFVNQLYRTPVEARFDKNPDLQAIRIASVNPILDPWIYILLRKEVLLKVLEKIKCLFCKMGGRTPQHSGNFHCMDEPRFSSVASHESPYATASWELREVTSSSQTFLYQPEKREGLPDGHRSGQTGVNSSAGTPALEGLRRSDSLNECNAGGRTFLGSRVSVSLSFPKDPSLHVTFTDEGPDLQEKHI
ncbi:prostaglandin E2 receptor EP4 subtype-like isoform X2 [Conger conger]|uniref:prostaglandin E2 receptor EP4 subtype-like isoform X2 n=1 Tax=Conger conger TaxID=82655 RepID=UPI002A598894|nr:prostaglandin E2 receptor EP4 subtype-like isoform X2 [Conger conger]